MDTIIPSTLVQLNSVDKFKHRTVLYQHGSGGRDIVSLTLSNIPDGLVMIELQVDYQSIFEVKADEIQTNENILRCAIPLSKCYRMLPHCLVFHFDKKYLVANESYELVDEMCEEKEHQDTEVEIFDGYVYHIGKQVVRRQVKTGRTTKKIVQGADVVIPEIKFQTRMAQSSKDESLYLPVWQYYKIFPKFDKQYLKRYADTHALTPLDEKKSVDELIAIGEPFECKMPNTIVFAHGTASQVYFFGMSRLNYETGCEKATTVD